MKVPVVIVATVMMTLVAQSAVGQVVAGIVVDGRDGQPLLDASVVLLDSRGEIKRGWLTDVDGVYQLMAPEPGRYTIRAGGPGLETWDSPPIQLDAGQELLMEIRLVPEGFYSGLAEFERRRDAYEDWSSRGVDGPGCVSWSARETRVSTKSAPDLATRYSYGLHSQTTDVSTHPQGGKRADAA